MKRAWWVHGAVLVLVAGYPAAGIALYDFENPQHETVGEWRERERTINGHVYWTQVSQQEFTGYWHRDWVREVCPSGIRTSLSLPRIFWPVQRIGCLLNGEGALIESRYDLSDWSLGNCVVIRDVRVVQP